MLSLINFLVLFAVTGYAVYLIAHLIYSRIAFIKLGKKSNLKEDTKQRIQELLINVFGQKKLLKDSKSGIMHVIMFYGFIILQFGAIELIIHWEAYINTLVYPRRLSLFSFCWLLYTHFIDVISRN